MRQHEKTFQPMIVISNNFQLPSFVYFYPKTKVKQYAANRELCCNYAAICSNMGIEHLAFFWTTTITYYNIQNYRR